VRIYKFRAVDQEQTDLWMAKIQKVIKYANPALRKAYLLLGEIQTQKKSINCALPYEDNFITLTNTEVTIWSKKVKKTFEPDSFVVHAENSLKASCVVLKPNTSKLFVSFENIIYKVDLATRNLIGNSFKGHTQAVNCLLLLDIVMWSGSSDCTMRVWNQESGDCLQCLTTENIGSIMSLKLVGYSIWCGTKDGDIHIWDATKFTHTKQLNKLHTEGITTIELLYDRIVWTAGEDKSVCIWT